MTWYNEIKKKIGPKRGLDQLTEDEMNTVIRDLQMQCRQLEKKVDAVEKHQINLAQEILKSSKIKASMLMEKLKQKKAIGNFYVKAYTMASRNATAMESVMEIKKIMGVINGQVSRKLEALSPTNIAAFLDVLQSDFNTQTFDSDHIMETLESFTDNVAEESTSDDLVELGLIQDDTENLSQEEKIKKIMDMA